MTTGLPSIFALALAAALATSAVRANGAEPPRLSTNEAFVEDAMRDSALAIDDPMAMFAYVLGALPDRVKVYPTENYYYFTFVHRHARYAGSIRLDVLDRDAGKVHFTYFADLGGLEDRTKVDQNEGHLVLDVSRGVTVEKLHPLIYRVSYAGKSVVFELNDLSQVTPPPGAMGPEEIFLGPIFDESAIRFFLIFNPALKVFHYVLDETVAVVDRLAPAAGSDRILIGQRTGFAFYRDHRLERKILIGVFAGHAQANNYFDGPFDQLGENFIEGDALRQAILAVVPELTGRIDRLGTSADGSKRYLIAPYLPYYHPRELAAFHACASRAMSSPFYHACFDVDATALADTRPFARTRPTLGPPTQSAKRGP
jgi:hypothetical protein